MDTGNICEIIGVMGVAVYLGSYAALQLGLLRGQGYAYASLNTLAAALVLVSLTDAFNLSSAIIQVSWIVIGVVGISRYYILTHRVRFDDEEKMFLEFALPTMDRIKARRLLDMGTWLTAEPNTVLTEAGIPVPNLVFLVDGKAEVHVDGSVVAVIEEKNFIGEMTALSGEKATATVIVVERSRCLEIPAEPLRQLLKKDPDMERELEYCFSSAVKQKLTDANRNLSERYKTELLASPAVRN